MAKLKKKPCRGRSIMGRSDIPLAQRLRMQQNYDIEANRGYAAKVMLYCISVALHEIDTHALQATQVAQIVASIAMNDEFGFGVERQSRIRDRIGELAKRYRDEGTGFLLEKMAAIGFTIVDGIAMVYMDEDGNAVHPSKAKKEGAIE